MLKENHERQNKNKNQSRLQHRTKIALFVSVRSRYIHEVLALPTCFNSQPPNHNQGKTSSTMKHTHIMLHNEREINRDILYCYPPSSCILRRRYIPADNTSGRRLILRYTFFSFKSMTPTSITKALIF